MDLVGSDKVQRRCCSIKEGDQCNMHPKVSENLKNPYYKNLHMNKMSFFYLEYVFENLYTEAEGVCM